MKIWRILKRSALGFALGYGAYLGLLWFVALSDVMRYGRADSERFFYFLFEPLVSWLALVPSSWHQYGERELHLMCAGGILIISGVLFANIKRTPK